ncbi:MAG TPA: NYN domain-containing protein, partial [Candidatus Limnocylindrales bacterium]|nr:NYN domain-containing protein [Candidatus Limnocylindrales bacterium]
MTRISPFQDPLTGTTRLLVDGTNLLHQLTSGPERQPPAALIGRLRAAIPASISIEIVFDGPAERGLRGERIAHGVSVRYGGRHSADTILVTLVEEVAMAAGAPAGGGSLATDGILVVTDDRSLRYAIQHRGARTAGASWLVRRMARNTLSSPSVGNARSPVPPRLRQAAPGSVRTRAGGPGGDRGKDGDDADGPGWSPGRGATRKTGNGK